MNFLKPCTISSPWALYLCLCLCLSLLLMCVYSSREDAHHCIIIVGLTRCTVPGIDCAIHNEMLINGVLSTMYPKCQEKSRADVSEFCFIAGASDAKAVKVNQIQLLLLLLPTAKPLQRLYHHPSHSLHRNIFSPFPFLPSLSPHSFGSSSSSSSSKQRPPLPISFYPTMDTLVARYSRSPFENEGSSSDDQHDYTDTLPPLSLRFALPPVARVSHLLPPPPRS
jgi:hypothetical protein